MKAFLILTRLACAGTAVFSMAGASYAQDCKPKHEFTTIEPGQLTVAVLSEMPTIDLKDGKLIGVQGMILNQFAKENCLSIVTEEIAGAGIIPAVQSGRVDIATGGWYRSKRRIGVIGMSYPIFLSKMALLSKTGMKTWQEALNHDIGTPTGNLWNDDAQKYYGDHLKLYQGFDQVYADMNSGRLEAGIVASELAQYVISKGIVKGATYAIPPAIAEIAVTGQPPQVGFPYVKENEAFGQALDETIKAMQESGAMEEAMKQSGMDVELRKVGEPYFIN
jgi:polar amino acid transport system substrate-binding protein